MESQEDRRERWCERQAEIHGISNAEYKAYKTQKDNARRRGIDFDFTPLGWAIWWRINLPASERRGRKRGQYVMARIGDKGAYTDTNVYLATHKQNANDRSPSAKEATRRKLRGHSAPHLKDRHSHPAIKRVQTPDGAWDSAALAADYYGITRQAAAYRARTRAFGWRYA